LHKVHLPHKAERFPDRRAAAARVAIVRAMQLARVLYDGPTGVLESETVGEVLKVMKWLADEGITSIVVTHEMSFCAALRRLGGIPGRRKTTHRVQPPHATIRGQCYLGEIGLILSPIARGGPPA
jgi:ABC-type lipoprotein export system ATPase subunit